ncbi:MAG: hypothetical protein C0392_06050 [Syntrophus sp. (in: bacteria)]|nr:hypothetical protein [Syntrophus sp. (in: bacteria)]
MSRKMILEKDGPKQKSHTITWTYQAIEQNQAQSGLEYLLAIKEGRISPPPVWNLIGCRLAEICEGRVTLEVTPAEYHYNRFGVVQGGILCTILDASMACTLSSSLSQGTGFSSPELNVNYFRPVRVETGVVRCESTIIHKGNRIAVLEGKILDREARLCAQSMATFMIFATKRKVD